MKRLWPRNLMGQMLLAVALALFLVQGIGAFLIYRAQSERREAASVHSVVFRLMTARDPQLAAQLDRTLPRHAGERRGPRIKLSPVSPVKPGEVREHRIERALARLLEAQGMPASQVIVTYRAIRDDPEAFAYARQRVARLGPRPGAFDGKIMIAAIRFQGQPAWHVARMRNPFEPHQLVGPLLAQTILIYLVVVGVIALVLRRITRPLAALKDQVERFAQTRDPGSQIVPQGPDDVRKLIAAQNAMEARIAGLLHEKDVMLGAIGHDLKTPLAALRVRIESVEDEAERGKMAATIEDIVTSLDDILSLARAGRPSDPPERVELSTMLAALVEEYEDMGKPVTFAPSERLVADVRSTWLRRAIRNLIDNALRYGARARVSLVTGNAGHTIVVEDDGPGIPEAEIAAMMEPFTRGEPSRNRGTGGAGLGLALARAVAEQHGGQLVLENRPNQGGSIAGLSARLTVPA